MYHEDGFLLDLKYVATYTAAVNQKLNVHLST